MSEQQARDFILDLLSLLARAATLTAATLDDQIAEGAIAAMKNDLLWSWAWRFIAPILNDPDGHLIVSVTCDTTVAQEADKVGIDPATLIMIINAVIELIKMFRNRKQG